MSENDLFDEIIETLKRDEKITNYVLVFFMVVLLIGLGLFIYVVINSV